MNEIGKGKLNGGSLCFTMVTGISLGRLGCIYGKML